jgi:hypothetical protein
MPNPRDNRLERLFPPRQVSFLFYTPILIFA